LSALPTHAQATDALLACRLHHANVALVACGTRNLGSRYDHWAVCLT
jgi:hypothetical protein